MAYSEPVSHAIAEGAKLYAIKQYDEAATKYADACAAYSEEHGEDDADLLLLYGKALFQSAVSRSGMLGGIGENEEGQEEKEEEEEEDRDGNFHFEDGVAQEVDEENNEEENEEEDAEGEPQEEEGANGHEEGKEAAPDQSDFEAAWEILELARSLLDKKLGGKSPEGLEKPYLKSSDEVPESEYVATCKKLSEVYDLLGEVSLEAENFAQAATDLKSCLDLRQKLYPTENGLISECHYKLSLALEFSLESDSRAKATEQMRLAIESVKLRNSQETDEEKKKDNEALLGDMEERYSELKKTPKADLQAQQMDIIKGIMGEAVSGAEGSGSSALKAVQDLTNMVKKKPAVNDLSSMVKKRKAKPADSAAKKPKTD